MKTLQKEINIYFPWPMKKEKNLTANTFGPTVEEFFSDKEMTAESLPSEVKRTLNISKTLWTTLKIPTKFLHLNQFQNSPMMRHLFCGSPLLKKKTTTRLGQFRESPD